MVDYGILNYMIRRLFLLFFILVLTFAPAYAKSPDDEFSFVVIGDTRPAQAFGPIPEIFSKAIEEISLIKPDFVIHLGDCICLGMSDENMGGIEEQWRAFRNEFKKLSLPLYVVAGNEDVWSEPSQNYYKKIFGDKLYHSFDYKNSHFIILDTEIAGFANDIPEEEMLWLKEDLQATGKENIFVFLHKPVLPFKRDSLSEGTRQYLKKLFAKYNARAVFSGHEHLYHEDNSDGVSYYITGGGGAPLYASADEGGFYHFLLIKVKGKDFKVEVVKIE